MGGACSAYGGGERRIQGFGEETWEERDNWVDPGIAGRIILRWIFRKWDMGGVDWIELAQDSDRWHALVNAVMNLRFP